MRVKTTKHGKHRIKSRVGVRNASYNYRLARKNGKKLTDFEGDFSRLLKFLEIKSKGKVIVYNNFIYIVKNEKLITVLNMPYKYSDYESYLKKKEGVENV